MEHQRITAGTVRADTLAASIVRADRVIKAARVAVGELAAKTIRVEVVTGTVQR